MNDYVGLKVKKIQYIKAGTNVSHIETDVVTVDTDNHALIIVPLSEQRRTV